MPPTENAYFETASIELEIHRGLRSVPGYLRFNMVIAGARRNGVLQIRKHFEGHGKMAGLALLGLHAASDIKTAIIVDDDIDPFDWDAVNWALSTRFNPAVDVEIMTGLPGNPLDPAMPKEEAYKANRISKIILDATKPLIEALPDTCLPHPDVMEAVRKNWARYGIAGPSAQHGGGERRYARCVRGTLESTPPQGRQTFAGMRRAVSGDGSRRVSGFLFFRFSF